MQFRDGCIFSGSFCCLAFVTPTYGTVSNESGDVPKHPGPVITSCDTSYCFGNFLISGGRTAMAIFFQNGFPTVLRYAQFPGVGQFIFFLVSHIPKVTVKTTFFNTVIREGLGVFLYSFLFRPIPRTRFKVLQCGHLIPRLLLRFVHRTTRQSVSHFV